MKLESLKDFQANSLNQMEMNNVFGGKLIDPSRTGAGTICASETGYGTNTECVAYQYDQSYDNGEIYFYNPSDVDSSC